MTPERRVRLRREAWGFAVGSLLFAVGAVPLYSETVGAVATNATFFAGAFFFTLAALIQLLLSGRRPPKTGASRPDRADWWAAAIQFAGTLLFNLSTTAALLTFGLLALCQTPVLHGIGLTVTVGVAAAFLLAVALAPRAAPTARS